ncbi:MAG: FKBP-type peptidyl-prolyl cis-trans isomerase [Simkaniaceae bacterium]|nr:MAG: FKBP-type peptidyl-prolyl cis-trans isomerase [Simkaniaceae bacterium]
MTTYEGEYNFDELSDNLQKLSTGKLKPKPLNDCYASLTESLEKKAEEKELLNLQAANSYLRKISNMNGIYEVVKDRLYYRVLSLGKGEEIKSVNNTPLVAFREKTLTGEVLSENVSGIRIPFSEMIPGLRRGLEGMNVGEKREIYIHPDLAYREFPKPEPYSLIIIEITVISP